ncbi:MAG: hypothetical protein IT373_18310 [Polyangiaceae bacterium]|nr:hypothetical protein [Polyangiaceae bacterium]
MTNDPERSRVELERALGATPAYEAWRPLDPGPGHGVDARYAALPATTTAAMRAATAAAFAPRDSDLAGALARGEAELVRTSGTTGSPVTLVWSQAWWDASERSSFALNTHLARVATGSHREAVLASPRCVGPGIDGGPRDARARTLGRLLFLNEEPDVARWSDAAVRRMGAELERYAPAVLEADPYYLAALCARAAALGVELARPELLVFTYARPSRLHLARIARALPVPIASSFGSTETGYVLVSCEQGRLHQNVASCRVDLAPLPASARAPDLCRLRVTPFGHPFMCLLRFDPGDLVRPSTAACPCGRSAGLVCDDVVGRVSDATLGADGRLVPLAELDAALASAASAEAIVSYQLEQQRGGALRLRTTADAALDAPALARSLRALYGARAAITVESVAALVPEPSGKYLAVRHGTAAGLG